ncbi:sodium:calcium antiporter [Micromonospora echinofusca]|uniref:Sodium:calcium antiporter n=1 Tax=Micromonospora echinofusca TaxID=47858 RepID=A0ABS3VVL1_MICEH|nr:sodium:calcium antiporter [Micromonospora echinofusca]MBO4208587.1 sodium:calcium antiporter [Micromonospora echinofusca]
MGGLSSALLLVIFLAAAGVIWGAGVVLSDATDVLSRRLRLGQALSGAILLAVATNLPEIAITTSAALAHHVDVAVGNILGGIAIQTAVLALLDAVGVRPRRPLTRLAASPTLLIECALVVALLLVVVMAAQLPGSVIVARLTPGVVLIGLLWIAGLLLVRRARRGLPGPGGGAADAGQPDAGDGGGGGDGQPDAGNGNGDAGTPAKRARLARMGTRRAALIFVVGAAATLAAGVLAAVSGQELFGRLGMSGVVFGATVLAAVTALPEVTTGLASTRLGDYRLAVSDILGGNAFLPVLFLLATVLSGEAVLPRAHPTDIYLTALGGLLTIVYLVGLVFRPQRQWLRMGPDSIAVLVLYTVGVAGLLLVPS